MSESIQQLKDRVEREADRLVMEAMNNGGYAALSQLWSVRQAVGDLANAEALERAQSTQKVSEK